MMQVLGPLLAHRPDVLVFPSLDSLFRRGHDGPASALHSRDTLAIADRLSSLDLPTRVVWGDADQFHLVAYGDRLAADLGTPSTRISGGKHVTPEDRPEAIADAVNALLSA